MAELLSAAVCEAGAIAAFEFAANELDEGAVASMERPELQPASPITSAATAAVQIHCEGEDRGLRVLRYVGIIDSPNAWGLYVGSVVPLLHSDSQPRSAPVV